MIDEHGTGDWQGKLKYSETSYTSAILPPQTPHDLTWHQNQAAAVEDR
jgi:hypothetical protein